jgi:hypothetical protein
MSEEANPWFARLEELNHELEELEQRTFKADQLRDLSSAREDMIRAMRSMGFSRYGHGWAIGVYRELYRKYGQPAWRDVAGDAGLKIARALGYKCNKSLSILITDAQFAHELDKKLRDAMITRSLDPAEGKNRDIVTVLRGKTRPENSNDAEKLVDEEIARHSERRRQQQTAESQQRLVNRIVVYIKQQPNEDWLGELKEILDQAEGKLRAEHPETAAEGEKNQCTPASDAGVGTMISAEVVDDSKPAGSALPVPRISPPSALERSAGLDPGPKHSHPWGDSCLNTLRLLETGHDGRRCGEFHRELLYDVRQNRKPTRYLVGGLLDLFDPGLDDKYFDEHVRVFDQAEWHTFLALTPHIDSVKRHWERWKEMTGHKGFPISLWPGAAINCVDDLERMGVLYKTGMATSWASFVGYCSNESRPLSTSSLLSDIFKFAPRLIVTGWDFSTPQAPLSVEDAFTQAKAAAEPAFCGTHFFFTHPGSREAFIEGKTQNISTKPTNPSVIEDPVIAEWLAWAQERQYLPDDWFRQPFPEKEIHFDEFKGDAVERFELND